MPEKSQEIPEFPLRSIYFYPTESCNLRCTHCWVHPAYAPDEDIYKTQNRENISVETMDRVVQDAIPLGLNHIKLTGGEPFLNPQLFEFLECFSRHGLSLSFETNGTLLTKMVVKRLKQYKIQQVSTSLDGSTPELHERIRRVKGSFDKTITGVRLLIGEGIYPQVIFCLQKINAHDLENTIQLAQKMGVRSFEINPLSLLGEGGVQTGDCEGLPIEELLSLEKLVEGELAGRYPDIHIDLYLPPALKGMKELSMNALYTCKIHNICGILSNGDVSICGIGRTKKSLIMGNVRETNIARIWEEGAIFREIREKVPFQMEGVCGRCLFKHHCLGFCRADVLFDKQSILEPYGICEEVFQKGLFPESRLFSDREISQVRRSRAI
ncbi:MAG: radical SAM protein [Deltaproteobacteria bacterium]|nr:radical SAM protein [Deltaproteobacteria bacterium]